MTVKFIYSKLGLILFLALIFSYSTCAQNFIHPGQLNTKAELDDIKAKILAGLNPWKSAFDKVKVENNYLSHTPGAMVNMIAEANRMDAGQRDILTKDAEIVYGCALIWYLGGDIRYAQKAIQVLNNWAYTNTSFTGFDAPLVAGYGPPPMVWGAEILRYAGSSGYTSTDIQKFESWLSNIVWPKVQPGSGNNPNWQQWMACSAMSIGIFTNDANKWTRGVELWRGVIGRTVNSSGIPGEWSRDLWHSQMGIAPAAYAAEIGRIQGIDLYSELSGSNRILQGAGKCADCIAAGLCSGTSQVAKGAWPYYQFVYNHYKNRKGLAVNPNILKLINTAGGKYNAGFETFERGGWGTLTHNGTLVSSPTVAVTGVTVSPTSASVAVNGTQQLTATVAPSNATNKNITWSSSNTTVATVGTTGLVTGKAPGNATITATTQNGGRTATSAITVTASSGGTNVALNKKVIYASSQQTGNYASQIVDGSTVNRWSANGAGFPQSVIIDLGSSYNLTKTEVLPLENRAYTYKIEVSADNISYTIAVDRTSNTESGAVLSNTISGKTGRYVKLTVTGKHTTYSGNWVSILELRVFGTSSTTGARLVIGENMDEQVTIYPNPVSQEVTVSLKGISKGKGKIIISDEVGLAFRSQNIVTDGSFSSFNLNVKGLKKGVYIVSIILENKRTNSRLIITE